jgi:membrane protease YdiL (CAAX protease family)
MPTQVDERFIASAEDWICECGRSNVTGLSMCPTCGRRPPRGVATVSMQALDYGRPTWQPKVRAVRLALGVIVLNILQGIFTAILVAAGRLERAEALQLSLFIGLVFYGIVAALLIGPLLTLQPAWNRGNPKTTRLLGAEVGVLAAGVLLAIGWAASGNPVTDGTAQALVSEGSFIRIVLAFFAMAVVAPVVEELLFRGVVAESMRKRGAVFAIFFSSLLFALAHLGGLVYYTGCGVILGILYWRRGLWASIAAHAAFNGSLVLMAVLVALGPTHLVAANGVSVQASSGWQLASDAPADLAMGLRGPSGATFAVKQEPAPFQIDLEQLAAALNNGQIPLPPETSISGLARVTRYPAGEAVEVGVTEGGHAGVVVLIPRGTVIWEVDVATAGSARAKADYPDMLQSLTLPPAGAL